MCGGVRGPRDRHRDLFADRHVPAGDAGLIVRSVIGFHRGQTTSEFNCAGRQPAVTPTSPTRASDFIKAVNDPLRLAAITAPVATTIMLVTSKAFV
jgi:hypothetical protein